MPRSRVAAAGVLLGGLAIILGTVLPWTPQGGPFFLMAMDGLSQSEGPAMIVLGVLLSLIGADALRRNGSSPFWAVGVAAGLFAAFILARRFGWAGYTSVGEFLEWGPSYGLYLVMLGAIVGVVASLGLRKRDRQGARQA